MINQVQTYDYYPFGLTFNSYQRVSAKKNDFLYNGKEMQDELGLDWMDYGARMYDAAIGRWHVVDPLSEIAPSWTPYRYGFDNPINYTDPTGMSEAPIYDEDANFLGTDNQGLQGKAIIMSKEDFKQGMSHDEALSKNKGAGGLNGDEAAAKFSGHYDGLKDRPDYDGVVTIGEGIDWAKSHPNVKDNPKADDALYLDASKMDFGNLSTSNFPLDLGVKGNVNLFDYKDLSSLASIYTTYALGNTQMKLINSNSGEVKLFSDGYDWNYFNYDVTKKGQSGTLPKSQRDRLIMLERTRAGLNDSHGFPLLIYGTGNIKTN